jgi:hypothetical protein
LTTKSFIFQGFSTTIKGSRKEAAKDRVAMVGVSNSVTLKEFVRVTD